ncbi:MAG: hypothetical protein MZW92_02625 [Comamonadaceae bacterium]|nr:hypothetical protein [Comamonadaceae bacterium]
MTNADFTELDEYKDIESHNIYKLARRLFLYSHKQAMKMLAHSSRDNARTPMQWDAGRKRRIQRRARRGSASTRTTPEVNVEAQIGDPGSIYRLLSENPWPPKKYDIIVYGDYEDIRFHDRRLYAYERRLDGDSLHRRVQRDQSGAPVAGSAGNLYGYDLVLRQRRRPRRRHPEAV